MVSRSGSSWITRTASTQIIDRRTFVFSAQTAIHNCSPEVVATRTGLRKHPAGSPSRTRKEDGITPFLWSQRVTSYQALRSCLTNADVARARDDGPDNGSLSSASSEALATMLRGY